MAKKVIKTGGAIPFTVTVETPPVLRLSKQAIEQATRVGLNTAGAELRTAIISSERTPKDRGRLAQGLRWRKAIKRGGVWVGGIGAVGVAAQYADVQDKGRRPASQGSKPPPFGAIAAWVRRKMPDVVDAYARNLQAAYKTMHPTRRRRGGKLVSRSLAKFKKAAIVLIAKGIIRKMQAVGMAGKRFATDPHLLRQTRLNLTRRIRQQLAIRLRAKRAKS